MGLDFITHNGNKYPDHESIGGASLWIRPLAQHYCKGKGLDIGYSKEAWMLPGAIGIEPSIDPAYDAMKLPNNPDSENGLWDFCHSSHCLEHVKANVYDVLDYWLSKIKVGGIMFLYLPHSSQTYWHPSSNRKHVHTLNEGEIETYLNDLGHKVYVSGCDWNHSFVVICEKIEKVKKIAGYMNSECFINLREIDELSAQEQTDLLFNKKSEKEILNDKIEQHSKSPYPQSIPDIPPGHYPVKDKPSFTRVTPENQNQFGDIPIGHYVAI